ncbi:MAG: tRNA (adenosine(37)-N6)-dimethylallyltransferase MiaA [Oscillospiraceae bacterium]|nr:tRNA (adenosine(37)-N6)-dimethylallyltransferase MiaA [Oscillospiraceae bacterium]
MVTAPLKKIPVIVVCGPTASGKTAAAIELAKRFDGEVISADSMQIYKELRICTARPTEEEMQGIPHHMMGFLSPDQKYSVAEYVKDAARVIKDVHERGKTPVIAGGTGLYIDSLVNGICFSEDSAESALRKELEERDESGEDLYPQLMSLDPEAAGRIHPNNRKRVLRFLEIVMTTGRSIAENERLSREAPSPYEAVRIGLTCENRQALYDRIDRRVDRMLSEGLVSEVRRVYELYSTRTAAGAIGYKELIPYLNNETDLETALGNIKQGTRRYAKRQLTWFRRDNKISWVYTDDLQQYDGIIKNCINIVENSKTM